MARTRFKEVLQKLHFSNNTEADESDKGYKIKLLITDFNKNFSWFVSNDTTQKRQWADDKI